MKKSGFTLVEMLIVIVIIGILWSALFSKVIGYLEKTRDLQRKIDLRNIAAAIEIQREKTGKFPTRKETEDLWWELYFWSANTLLLNDNIINSIPNDPKKNMIKLHEYPYTDEERTHHRWWKNRKGGVSLKPWEYLYQLVENNGIPCWWAVIVAKVETSDAANFVFDKTKRLMYEQGGTRPASYYTHSNGKTTYICPDMQMNKLHLCSHIEKKEQIRTALIHDDPNCTYTDAEQLYYIVKIK